MREENRTAFAFEGLGKLGALGHNCAIADVFGVKVSGLPAWLLWRTIYLMKLPGINTKIRVAADWLIALLLPRIWRSSAWRVCPVSTSSTSRRARRFFTRRFGGLRVCDQEGECDVLRTIDGQEQKLAELKNRRLFVRWLCCLMPAQCYSPARARR